MRVYKELHIQWFCTYQGELVKKSKEGMVDGGVEGRGVDDSTEGTQH